MKFSYNKIVHFQILVCIECRLWKMLRLKTNSGVVRQRGHCTKFFAMWFSNCFGSKEGWNVVNVC
jgi:hypothetical protein